MAGTRPRRTRYYSVYDFARSQIDPYAWLDGALSQYDADSEEALLRSGAAAGLMKKSLANISARCDALQAARNDLMQDGAETPAAFIDGELLTGARTSALPKRGGAYGGA